MMIHGVQPECDPLQDGLPAATSSMHAAASQHVELPAHLHGTLSAAAHAHLAQPTNDTHRAKALAKQQQDVKLMQPPFASTRAE